MGVRIFVAGREQDGGRWHFETTQLDREHFVAVAVLPDLEPRPPLSSSTFLAFEHPTFQQLTSRLKARQPEKRIWWERFSMEQR